MDRRVNVIVGTNGEKIVLINDAKFKGKRKEDWKEVENYLKGCCRKSESKCFTGYSGVNSDDGIGMM